MKRFTIRKALLVPTLILSHLFELCNICSEKFCARTGECTASVLPYPTHISPVHIIHTTHTTHTVTTIVPFRHRHHVITPLVFASPLLSNNRQNIGAFYQHTITPSSLTRSLTGLITHIRTPSTSPAIASHVTCTYTYHTNISHKHDDKSSTTSNIINIIAIKYDIQTPVYHQLFTYATREPKEINKNIITFNNFPNTIPNY